MEKDLVKTLLKKATGYSHNEVQEEYSVDETGGVVLAKRKVTKKYYPPDPIALKTYLELSNDKVTSNFSDSELECEKQRLLKQLKTENDKNTKVNEQKAKVNNTQKAKVNNTQKAKVNKNTQANNNKSVKPNNQKVKVNDDKNTKVNKQKISIE